MTMQAGNGLSEREVEILRLVATGVSNKEIAHKLSISPNTVKVHLRNIFGKISAESRTEAALYAVRSGLVETTAALPRVPDLVEGSFPVSQSIPENDGEHTLPTRLTRWPRRLIWAVIFSLFVLIGIGIALLLNPRGNRSNAIEVPATAASVGSSRWQNLNALPEARTNLAAVVFENQVYAIGGETDNGLTGLVEVFDPLTNTWSVRMDKPSPTADIQAVVIAGKIYVPGGRLADGTLTDRLEIYDPRQDRWENGASMPVSLSAYSLATVEGRLFLFGGWDGKEYVDSVYEYNLALDTWVARTPMPTRRGWSGAAESGGKIYVVGGFDGQQTLAVNEVYDPAMDEGGISPWTVAESLPEGRFAFGMVGISGVLVIIGGENSTGEQAPPMHYFPSLNKWQVFDEPFSEGWIHAGTTSLEGYIYIVGGEQNGKPLTQLKAYQAVFTAIIPLIR